MTDHLDSAPLGLRVRIAHIDWQGMSADEGRRLREFGMMEGVEVVPLHRGSIFSRDPLSLSVGRMQVVIRSAQALAIQVEPATA